MHHIRISLTEKSAGILLALTSLIWGSSFVCYKSLMDLLSPVQFVVLRSLFAALSSGLFFILAVRKVNRHELLCGLLLGSILAAAGLLQTYGIQSTSAGSCAFLTGTNVVMVPFLSWALTRRRPGRRSVISACAMFLGVCVLTVDPHSISGINKGDLLSFAGAFLYAVHIAVTGVLAGRVRPAVLVSLQFVFLFAVNLCFVPFSGNGPAVPAESILPAAYLGIFTIFGGHSLQIICQSKTDSMKAAVLLSLEGVFGSLFAVIFLGERYTATAVIGFLLIFSSIFYSQTQPKQSRRRDNSG